MHHPSYQVVKYHRLTADEFILYVSLLLLVQSRGVFQVQFWVE